MLGSCIVRLSIIPCSPFRIPLSPRNTKTVLSSSPPFRSSSYNRPTLSSTETIVPQ